MAEFPETVETQPELMGYHLAQAGPNEKAIEYLRKAGEAPYGGSSPKLMTRVRFPSAALVV